MGIHIGAVFILLAVSALGAFGPILLRVIRSKTFRTALKIGTFFAFGTVLATGFIHMLQPANEALTSACLPASWNESYEAYAYLFAVLAILAMQAFDFAVQQYQCRMGDLAGGDPCCNIDRALELGQGGAVGGMALGGTGGGADSAARRALEQPLRKDSHSHSEEDAEEDAERTSLSRVASVYLMEAGIVFHSVVIGITLGVSTGAQFKTLMIVLSFHQFFEGFAIGFTAVDARLNGLKLFVVGLIYSLTTPIGVAIGIGIRQTYNGNDATTLLVQGIFDAVSAGILIYVALVQLITPQFTHNKWLTQQSLPVKLLSFAALYGGFAVMAVIGKQHRHRWARVLSEGMPSQHLRDEESGLLQSLQNGSSTASGTWLTHRMQHAPENSLDRTPDDSRLLGAMQGMGLASDGGAGAKPSPEMEYLSGVVARGVAVAVEGTVEHAMSAAVHTAIEDQNIHFDVKVPGVEVLIERGAWANLGTLVAVTGVILFWRGVWNMDTVVGVSLTSDLLSMGIGLGTMLCIRYFRVPLARTFPEM
ncbi:hypothetical protein APUTEX25_001572 [Auxenochlorella protothecoides]|uniref:Zinc transporter 5 n=1 Tax=Auxenochlorella protothecoides TaxID=3075 RepID=A0A3M7KS15_AUXPR|nr:hypothetical protein APUTEX25_001572 [Auxenochlorella protothecoides]|eukprot:RMZ52182.1 hypothetical protein APUTEX25_001572 [Auxenochlorella protothecoides]